MRTIYLLILTFAFLGSQAQTNGTAAASPQKKEVENQGGQEDYWIKQFFEQEYSKQSFERYRGEVIADGDSFTYGDRTLTVSYTAKELTTIFSSGIFYPELITGYKPLSGVSDKSDTATSELRLMYRVFGSDSLHISRMKELAFLSGLPTQKRFQFWLLRPGLLNPTVWFIELTNEKANSGTDMKTFIDGATLTFCRSGWIII